MKVHPVFHNSLLKPYVETTQYGPNFARPPPDIVAGEEGHYKIEKILASHPTRNRKSTQYLVKWKGYPDSENSWLPAKELTHAKTVVFRVLGCSRHGPVRLPSRTPTSLPSLQTGPRGRTTEMGRRLSTPHVHHQTLGSHSLAAWPASLPHPPASIPEWPRPVPSRAV